MIYLEGQAGTSQAEKERKGIPSRMGREGECHEVRKELPCLYNREGSGLVKAGEEGPEPHSASLRLQLHRKGEGGPQSKSKLSDISRKSNKSK